MKKSELLDWLQQEYRQWQAFLLRIGPARVDQPGVNGPWTIKDMVAHLTVWNRWLVTRMQAAQHGEPEPAPHWPAGLKTEDEINAWIYETNRLRSLREVLDKSCQVFEQLFTIIQSLPDEVRIEPEWRLVWLGDEHFPAGEFFDHFHDDHEADIRAWLERTKSQPGDPLRLSK